MLVSIFTTLVSICFFLLVDNYVINLYQRKYPEHKKFDTCAVNEVCKMSSWLEVFRIIPDFRILRLSFYGKETSKC